MLGTTPMTVRGLDFEPEPEGVVKKETEANASFVSLFNKPYKFGDLEVRFQDEGGLLNLAGLSQPDMKKLIKKFHLPLTYASVNPEEIANVMTRDKKGQGGSLKMVQLEKIGQAELFSIDKSELLDFLLSAPQEGEL